MSKISPTAKNNKFISRNRNRNKKYKLAIKTATKKCLLSTQNNQMKNENLVVSLKNLSLAYKKIDKAVKRKVLHKNTASRKKARLAKVIQKLSS